MDLAGDSRGQAMASPYRVAVLGEAYHLNKVGPGTWLAGRSVFFFRKAEWVHLLMDSWPIGAHPVL